MSLNPLELKAIDQPGSYSDGEGLFLKVGNSGSKSWIYRYQLAGRRRDIGLGRFPKVSLAKARLERDRYRRDVKAGIDPLHQKDLEKAQNEAARQKLEAKKQLFSKCAEDFIEAKRHEWKNKKHAQQWENTLKTYAYPVISELSVCDIELDHILKILKPIWLTKTETATRVRNRVELILDYATVLKYRTGENPARWRGNLDKLLASPTKVKASQGEGHHSALPYDDIHEFMKKLKEQPGLASKALQLVILTASRTSEVLHAEWGEFDLDAATWTIPKSRMKAAKSHRIPLSTSSLVLLESLKEKHVGRFVFPGLRKGRPLSNMAMANVLKRMGRDDITVHGFRSTFRDWVAEKTNYPRRVAETALAHKLKDGSEAAYQRGDLIEKRQAMMEDWARYCLDQKSSVIRMRTYAESVG